MRDTEYILKTVLIKSENLFSDIFYAVSILYTKPLPDEILIESYYLELVEVSREELVSLFGEQAVEDFESELGSE